MKQLKKLFFPTSYFQLSPILHLFRYFFHHTQNKVQSTMDEIANDSSDFIGNGT